MTNTTSCGTACSLRHEAAEENADMLTKKSRSASSIDGSTIPAAAASSSEAYTDLSTHSRSASSVENELPSEPPNSSFQACAVEGSATFEMEPGMIVGSEASGDVPAEMPASLPVSA